MNPFSRRSFLAALTLPAWYPRVAFSQSRAASPARDVLVAIFQRGGNDALNTVVPVGDADYYRGRPTLAIPEPGGATGAALDLDGFFGFHPALAPLKELWDDGALAAVHAVGSPDDTRSHFDAMDGIERGTPGSQSVATGWLGRHLASLATGNDSPFRAVGLGTLLPASLRGPVSATALQSIADYHLGGAAASPELTRFQASLAALYDGTGLLDNVGKETFDSIALLERANPGGHAPQNGAVYPDSEFGLAMKQVAQLVVADVGLEIACVDLGGWDTHAAQGGATGQQATLLDDLAKGMAAFHADLGDRMAHVTVVTMSEFGRRAAENASGGTDHGHGGAMLVLGGGIEGGRVHGHWPGLAPSALVGPGDLASTTDFRTVLAEILERRLGNNKIGEVFPGFANPGYLGVARAA